MSLKNGIGRTHSFAQTGFAMRSLFYVLDLALSFYFWVLVIGAILSWLLAFQVLNTRSPVVWQINNGIRAMTEPVLRRLRRFVPNLGGLDLSPLVLILLIIFVRSLLREYGLLP